MGRASKAIVLAEDQFHQRFVYRYLSCLTQFRNPTHDIRGRIAPRGRGSGEQWVREQYASEVREHRSRAVQTALVVVIDADTNNVDRRTQQLRDTLAAAGLQSRTANERIVHLIPKRNIETWVVVLNGIATDETADFTVRQNVAASVTPLEAHIKPAANTLFDWSRPNAAPPAHCVDSLRRAIPEVRRLE